LTKFEEECADGAKRTKSTESTNVSILTKKLVKPRRGADDCKSELVSD